MKDNDIDFSYKASWEHTWRELFTILGKRILSMPSKIIGFKPICLIVATWLLIKGLIRDWIWFCVLVIVLFGVFGVIFALWFFHKRERTFSPKELFEYVEKQQAIENLREDYVNRDPDKFLELPGVRGAVDGATVEFLRKRDKAVQRLRSGHPD